MNPLGTGDPLRLGPYRLLGVLGEGGMGKVYVGQDGAGTVAAVKVLRPELADDTNLARRFVREAQAAQAVHSTGVAAVLGAHTEGGRPWIASEYLAGPTLDEAVDAYGPLDETAVRALAASIARTLDDVHAAGFIHRDLKPPNIVLTSSGPRVIDFGIARPEHGLTLTTTGQIPVTPGYGAPEQVLGRRVAPPADVFSLGAVLVYAATGRRAYDGTHVAAVQYEVVHGEPQLEGLSPQLLALIAPCLAKDPAARPSPAQVAAGFGVPRGAGRAWRRGPVAQEIKRRESGIKELTTVVTGAAPQGGVSRRRLLSGFAAGGTAVLAGGGGTAWWLGRESEKAKEASAFDIPPAARKPQARVLTADAGDYIVGESSKALWGPQPVASPDGPGILPVRDVVVLAAVSGGLTARNVVDGKHRWSAPDIRMSCRYLSLSDRLVAAADWDGILRTFVASTGEPKWTADVDAEVLLAADGDAVYVVTKDRRLRSVGRSDARIRWTVRIPTELGTPIEARGAIARGRLVVATPKGHVFAVATDDGRQVWDLEGQSESMIKPVVDADTVYLHGRELSALRISDGEKRWSAKSDDEAEYGAEAWGPATVHNGVVYATSGGGSPTGLSSRDGSEAWSTTSVGDVNSPLVVQGSGVWTFCVTGTRTMRLAGGEEEWVYDLPDSLRQAKQKVFAGDGNRVFVSIDGWVCALPVF
ncbi:serine/threonine-protein kinase [Streptomyces sp. NBC_01361]|uniref:serine/threonine-protein kinase n=1 Tax=Streptomyces sp. NBC_01361 TaxID=2903838 RepID=UPI002E347AC2|nr:serine/threonine-protein kinase [Streptomyces sp. NBC_01361]